MWLKLGNEFLNLDQVVRIRFNKGFRGGQEELAAELETLIKGELQILTRYRGAEAVALQAALAGPADKSAPPDVEAGAAPPAGHAPGHTPHDVKLP